MTFPHSSEGKELLILLVAGAVPRARHPSRSSSALLRPRSEEEADSADVFPLFFIMEGLDGCRRTLFLHPSGFFPDF